MFQPALFISHGAPDIALRTEHPAYVFLEDYGKTQPRPDAIVIFSGHWLAGHTMVSNAESYRAIYDFGGFDRQLYSMGYAPGGNKELAEIVAGMLKEQDPKTELVHNPTLDHGIWIPLRIMYPDANIPVVQVSLQAGKPASYYYALGQSLADLKKQNVLVIGSGALTHNLYELDLYNHEAQAPPWVATFAEWIRKKVEEGDNEALFDYLQQAPYARQNHPTDDHLIPLFVAMGAGGKNAERIHTSSSYKTVMMDAYSFSESNTDRAQ